MNIFFIVDMDNPDSDSDSDEEVINFLMDDDTDFYVANSLLIFRQSALYRRRWDETYIRRLAEEEGTFLAEYRLDPGGFDVLHELLHSRLQVDELQAARQSATSKAAPVTVTSRVGAALIMLDGGRRIEAIRTHGISQPQAYKN